MKKLLEKLGYGAVFCLLVGHAVFFIRGGFDPGLAPASASRQGEGGFYIFVGIIIFLATNGIAEWAIRESGRKRWLTRIIFILLEIVTIIFVLTFR
jgi:hypothetical protein